MQKWIIPYLLMELSPSGGAANSAAIQEFPSIYGTRRWIILSSVIFIIVYLKFDSWLHNCYGLHRWTGTARDHMSLLIKRAQYVKMITSPHIPEETRDSSVPYDSYFMLVSYLAYPSILNIEATYSSETSVTFQQTIWHYIPKDAALYS
jgi:hypothetical protein